MKQYKLIKKYPNCPPLGTIATYKDNLWMSMNLNLEHDYLINIKDECLTEFWKEITKDWEILTFKNKNSDDIYRKLENLFSCGGFWSKEEELLKDKNLKIHSIKRLSDGEIFTIGDKCSDGVSRGEIKSFHLNDNIMNCNVYGVLSNIRMLAKIKQPLFTTEDGVDIYDNDRVYEVILSNFYLNQEIPIKLANQFLSDAPKSKIFSTKEAAEEYIILNKPSISINDLIKLNLNKDEDEPYPTSVDVYVDELEKLVKSKL